jgi:hypothetical protein
VVVVVVVVVAEECNLAQQQPVRTLKLASLENPPPRLGSRPT